MATEDTKHHVVDIEELKEIMDGDMELIKDCFSDFAREYPDTFDEIKQAAAGQNGPNLDSSAHKLKGTLRYLAAGPAADAAYALELSGKTNNMQGIENKLETLNNECQKLLDFINDFKG